MSCGFCAKARLLLPAPIATRLKNLELRRIAVKEAKRRRKTLRAAIRTRT